MKSYIMVDIEADGPCPGMFSMISIGAVFVYSDTEVKFYREIAPISENYVNSMLSISGYTREQTEEFENPKVVMSEFRDWILQNSANQIPVFVSDNNGFDWMFICWYFYRFIGANPFGFDSINLDSLVRGKNGNLSKGINYEYKRVYNHNALDDALINRDVLLNLNISS
jgi:DNA polymerase III alpha subunit (gram-positive type)